VEKMTRRQPINEGDKNKYIRKGDLLQKGKDATKNYSKRRAQKRKKRGKTNGIFTKLEVLSPALSCNGFLAEKHYGVVTLARTKKK